MTRSRFKGFLPILMLFVITNSFFFSGKNILARWHADQDVLIVGNILLFGITLISFFLAQRGMNHSNPNVFIRAVYASVMIKLFVCMIAAFVYISINKTGLNKPALFTCMGLYLLYTFMEVGALMKMLKRKSHG